MEVRICWLRIMVQVVKGYFVLMFWKYSFEILKNKMLEVIDVLVEGDRKREE